MCDCTFASFSRCINTPSLWQYWNLVQVHSGIWKYKGVVQWLQAGSWGLWARQTSKCCPFIFAYNIYLYYECQNLLLLLSAVLQQDISLVHFLYTTQHLVCAHTCEKIYAPCSNIYSLMLLLLLCPSWRAAVIWGPSDLSSDQIFSGVLHSSFRPEELAVSEVLSDIEKRSLPNNTGCNESVMEVTKLFCSAKPSLLIKCVCQCNIFLTRHFRTV